jgi:putative ABC transport system permease protein
MGSAPLEGFTAAPPLIGAAGKAGSRVERYRRGWRTFAETLKLAVDAIRAHKLRSFLTLLGVILAVTTLVFVMSVIAGMNFYVADKIANLGANTYLVHRFGIITSEDAWIKAQKRPLITLEEFTLLRENMKTALRIAGEEDQSVDVRYENLLLENSSIVGVTANYADIENLNLAQGRFLTDADDLHHAPVAFIGADVVKKFFPTVDPVGKTIRAGTHTYEIVGVAVEIGSVFGESQDNFVLIPLSTYVKEWKTQREGLTLFVQARNAEIMETSQDEARMYMRAMRHLSASAEDNFAIFGSASIMSLWQQITGNLFFMATMITSVFLVVGGIVIMNIMLASVTERTREIGLRRALGARKSHIVLQFMTESALMSLVGGVIGLLLAYGLVSLGKALTPIPMEMPLSAVIISLVLSTSVGLFFGIYPATRAAKLDPIEALRADG